MLNLTKTNCRTGWRFAMLLPVFYLLCSATVYSQQKNAEQNLYAFNTLAKKHGTFAQKDHANEWVRVDALNSPGGSGSASLEQVRNGSALSPVINPPWVNGNAGASNAHYTEGWAIPYRLVMTGLSTGTHIVVLEWDTKASGKNALDFLTHYDLLDYPAGTHNLTFGHGKETITPNAGYASLTASTTNGSIPAPTFVPSAPASFTSLTADQKKMTIYGGTISSITIGAQTLSTSQVIITFSASGSTAILSWGAHIASRADWGGNSAASISGSSYHMRLGSLDGSGGNQDRSLSASAVVLPPPCNITAGATSVCPNSTSNTYTANAPASGYTNQWQISGNGSFDPSNQSTTGNSVTVTAGTCAGGPYTVTLNLVQTGTTTVVSTCSRTATVTDVQNPVITFCPADVTVECGGSTAATAQGTGIATATDNCSVTVTSSDATSSVGCVTSITRTWTATDGCGNTATAVQHIMVRDRAAPVFDCTAAYGITPTVTDNCTPTANIIVYSVDAGNSRTWTAIDASGNAGTCVQTNSITTRVSNSAKEPAPAKGQNEMVAVQTTAPLLIADSKPRSAISDALVVRSYPNPFSNTVTFTFVSPLPGKALLEVYDMVGKKLGVVFEGNVSAGVQKTITYNIPAALKIPMVYKVKVGTLSEKGKLLPGGAQ